ncbi:hypothetical protein CRG98_028871, partial [Punica granatum]
LMLEKDHIMEVPPKQRMERQETIEKEHTEEYQAALKRAVTLAVPHAFSPSQYGTFNEQQDKEEEGQESGRSSKGDASFSVGSSHKNSKNESWDELIERLFDRDESGHMTLKKSHRGD